MVVTILWIAFTNIWLVSVPIDLATQFVSVLKVRMLKGWVRRRLVRNFGPLGETMARIMFWFLLATPASALIFTTNWQLGMILIHLYWLVILIVNVIDFITSWEDPPWKRARKWVSERIQKLLQDMGERSRTPQPIPIPR